MVCTPYTDQFLIHAVNCIAHRIQLCHWIAGGAEHDAQRGTEHSLRIGQVVAGSKIVAQAAVLNVGDDTDDLAHRRLLISDTRLHAPAYWVLMGKILAGKTLANDNHVR